MKENNKKKRNILIVACIVAGICLAGAAAAAVFIMQKNPLAEGLVNLSNEVTALEAELGEHFWTDAINQIGSGNVQAEYSLNIGGISELQNMTIGLDGGIKRDMEQQLFETDIQVSVANVEIVDVSVQGTKDILFVQVPSVWDGSVVLETENVSGQWDDSFAREQLQTLTGQGWGINHRIDVKPMESFSIKSFSVAGFLRENAEALKALYEDMEVIKIRKAQKEGMLNEKQAERLEGYSIQDAKGNLIETTCYLVVLPGDELKEIFEDITSDIRLAVYLDQEKRIVRITTLPEEVLITTAGECEISLNLTGTEATIDRLEIMRFDVVDGDKVKPERFKEGESRVEAETTFIIEKEADRTGAYDIESEVVFTYRNNVWEVSVEGSIQGERTEAGEKLSLAVKNLTLGSPNEVLGRFSGNVLFEPLAESFELPSGKEYRIEEMSEMETTMFLMECTANVYKNYSGYLKMLQ